MNQLVGSVPDQNTVRSPSIVRGQLLEQGTRREFGIALPRCRRDLRQHGTLDLRGKVVGVLVLIELACGVWRAERVRRLRPHRGFDERQPLGSVRRGTRRAGRCISDRAGGQRVSGGSERPAHARWRPSTASSRAVRARALKGLVMKSSAPSSNTRTSLSSSPLAVSTTTGMCRVAVLERSCCRTP